MIIIMITWLIIVIIILFRIRKAFLCRGSGLYRFRALRFKVYGFWASGVKGLGFRVLRYRARTLEA